MESLWGMVDWLEGRCDFNTPLFGRLLEAARQYGDDGWQNWKNLFWKWEQILLSWRGRKRLLIGFISAAKAHPLAGSSVRIMKYFGLEK